VRRAVRDLERIGPPPYAAGTGGLDVRARWTDRLGGAVDGSTGPDLAFRALRCGSEYTWGDLLRRLLPGARFWMRNLDASLDSASAGGDTWDIPVPLTVIGGSDDWMAPLSASRRTFERARAPRKNLIELEGLGHYPFAQAPDRFADALTR
jgi:pimeloyl-ACP methyl ester carboxylesterase